MNRMWRGVSRLEMPHLICAMPIFSIWPRAGHICVLMGIVLVHQGRPNPCHSLRDEVGFSPAGSMNRTPCV